MIAFLSGKLIAKFADRLIVDVQGIGFSVFVPKSSMKSAPEVGEEIRLFTVPHLTRDALDLYGFFDEKERSIFEALTSVGGVGPKAAIKILGAATVEELETGIRSGRTDILMKATGVGGKKAERIILELRDVFQKADAKTTALALEFHDELHGILKKLGYKDQDIRGALRQLPRETKTLEEQLKIALKTLSRS